MSEPTFSLKFPKLALPTLGGKQIWGDELLWAGFRIQRNTMTGHHRLLDPGDILLASGSWDRCHAALDRLRARRRLEPASDHLVLLLHGIFRSKDALSPMARALRAAGYEAHSVNYPSTRRSLEDHAMQVERILNRMGDEVGRVSFVTHSMGGIVARVLLARDGDWRRRIEPHRLVMIATPNKGAALAAYLRDSRTWRAIAGPSLDGLHPDHVAVLPPPDIPFGVIAGARGDGRGYNPLIEGDDDMTVATASALLDGAEDQLVIAALHSFIMVRPAVIRATVRYLHSGSFRA